MGKITKDELIKRIDEIEKHLLKKLDLKNTLNDVELALFYESFIPYLNHNRKTELIGRNEESVKLKLDLFYDFAITIGLNNREIVNFIKEYPSVLNVVENEKFLQKYIFLSIIENESNTLRKENLIKRPKDFRVSLETIYARYAFMKYIGYDKISWSILIRKSHNEFINRFVKKEKNNTSYQILEKEISSETLKTMFPIDYNFIDSLKNNGLNNFGGIDGKVPTK